MIQTFLTGFIPVSLFLIGTIFYTAITAGLLIVAVILFLSYLLGIAIRSEFEDKEWN